MGLQSSCATFRACCVVEETMVGCPQMQSLRRRLRRFAGGWLVFQLSALMSIPTALCLTMPTSATGAECTCAHEDGQLCPMHHTRSKSNASSCSCRSTSDPIAAIAASLFGPSAVLTRTLASSDVTVSSDTPRSSDWSPIEMLVVPDAPPPRA